MQVKMKIQKRTLTLAGIGLAILIIVGLLFVLYRQMDKKWNDVTTWNENGFVFPEETNDLNVKKSQEGDIVNVEVPFCMLFRIDRGENITYNCSLAPSIYFDRYKLVNNNSALISDSLKEFYVIDSDVRWTFKAGKDPYPKAFLNNKMLSENSFTSLPEKAIPVKVSMSYKTVERPKNLFSMIVHFFVTAFQNKKEDRVLSSEIVEWSVEHIPTADEYFSEKSAQTYLKDWRTSFIKEMTDFMEPSRIKDLEGEGLVAFMGLKLAFDYKECFKDETAGYICRAVNANNPGSYLPYLLATVKNGDRNYYEKLKKAIYQVMEPFYSGRYEFKALKPIEKQNEPSFQSYNYPICPINELNNGDTTSFEVKMFLDYMKAYDATNDGSKIEVTTISLSDYFSRSSSLDLGKQLILTPEIVADLNENCARFIKSGKKLDSITFHKSLSSEEQNVFLIFLSLKYGNMFQSRLTNLDTSGTSYDYHKIYSIEDKDLTSVAKHIYNELAFQPYKTAMISHVSGIYDKTNEYNDRPDLWAWRRSYTGTQTWSLIFYYGTDAVK